MFSFALRLVHVSRVCAVKQSARRQCVHAEVSFECAMGSPGRRSGKVIKHAQSYSTSRTLLGQGAARLMLIQSLTVVSYSTVLLLQNVERGSQTLDVFVSEKESLSFSQQWRDHRKTCPASGMHSTAVYLRHVSKEDGSQHSLTLSLCSLSMMRVKVHHLAHHQEWKAKYPIQKKLVIKEYFL